MACATAINIPAFMSQLQAMKDIKALIKRDIARIRSENYRNKNREMINAKARATYKAKKVAAVARASSKTYGYETALSYEERALVIEAEAAAKAEAKRLKNNEYQRNYRAAKRAAAAAEKESVVEEDQEQEEEQASDEVLGDLPEGQEITEGQEEQNEKASDEVLGDLIGEVRDYFIARTGAGKNEEAEAEAEAEEKGTVVEESEEMKALTAKRAAKAAYMRRWRARKAEQKAFGITPAEAHAALWWMFDDVDAVAEPVAVAVAVTE